jgi:hypothetical protein
MTWFLITTCCKEKYDAPGKIPAIRRYQSERIHRVYAESRRRGLPMRILSGKFGLLSPEDPIPWYDHPLQMSEAAALAPRLADSLAAENAAGVYFIARPAETPGWAPYHTALTRACQKLEIPVVFIEYHPNPGPLLADRIKKHPG